MRDGASGQVVFPESYSLILMVALGFHHLWDVASLEGEEWLLFPVMGASLLSFQPRC